MAAIARKADSSGFAGNRGFAVRGETGPHDSSGNSSGTQEANPMGVRFVRHFRSCLPASAARALYFTKCPGLASNFVLQPFEQK